MPNGYPCPACGDEEAPLFTNDKQPNEEALKLSKPALSCAYACQACMDEAKVEPSGDFVAPVYDLTSTNFTPPQT